MKTSSFNSAKPTNKDLINLIATVMELTMEDFGIDQEKIGKYRYRFIKNLSEILALSLTSRMKIKNCN